MIRTEYNGTNWEFPFVSYTPSVYDKSLPLVIQLHGAGERGEGKEELHLVDVHGFSKLLVEGDYPCIVVMPQCPKDSFWVARIESLVSFIDHVIEHFGTNKSNTSLTGLSMGGYGTWYTAMAHPEMFSAIAPVCGGGMPWNAGVLNMPIWAFHGALDTVVSPACSEEMVKKLCELNKDVQFTLVPNVGHNVWENAYDVQLLKWLINDR